GVDGVMLRCASSALDAKDTYVSKDSKFEDYYYEATQAGLRVGAYIFSQALSVDEANQHAEYVLNLLNGKNITLPVAFDYEMQKRLKNARLSKEAKTAIAEAFCVSIKRGGFTPLLYSNSVFLTEEIDADMVAKNFGIWVARYNSIVHTETDNTNKYSGPVTMWQCTDSASIDGVVDNLDLNYYYEPRDINVARVTGITIKSGKRSIKVSWKEVPDVTGYQVYRSEKKKSGYVKIKTTGSEYYRNTALKAGKKFFYKVRAYRVIHGREYYGKWSLIRSGKAK
ncbi:MAG: hypothetical protein K6F00_05580, partial [Lachnospiraceae bacterium]|nr:hypothetical protein [Lachnospiraceae bacterium]